MFKIMFAIFSIIIFLNGCGYKTDPVYVENEKVTVEK